MNNQKGVTLIEVLAALTLITIVFLLTFNLLISGQKEQIKQVSANTQLQDVSYAMKLLTKDIRKATIVVAISGEGDEDENVPPPRYKEYKIVDYNGNEIFYQYDSDSDQLSRNGVVITNTIDKFKYSLDSSSIYIELINSSKETNSQKAYSTRLYFRKGE